MKFVAPIKCHSGLKNSQGKHMVLEIKPKGCQTQRWAQDIQDMGMKSGQLIEATQDQYWGFWRSTPGNALSARKPIHP